MSEHKKSTSVPLREVSGAVSDDHRVSQYMSENLGSMLTQIRQEHDGDSRTVHMIVKDSRTVGRRWQKDLWIIRCHKTMYTAEQMDNGR